MPTEKSPASFAARIMGNTKWTRWFARTALMQAVSLGLVEGVVLYLHNSDARKIGDAADDDVDSTFRSLFVYHILFILAQFFQLVLVFDALRGQNIMQIIAVGGFNLLMLAYSVVQRTQTHNLYETNEDRFPTLRKYLVYTVEYVVIGLSLIFTTVLSVMSFNLYREFGWSIYKTIGADLRMRDIYKNYLALVLLLKLDVFFFVGFSFQFVALAIEESDRIMHICLAITFAVILLVSASVGLRYENKRAMLIFLAGCFPTVCYMVYKLVTTFKEARFEKFRIFIGLFLVCSIALSLITIVLAWRAYRNFGKGLLTHLEARRGSAARRVPSAPSSVDDIPLKEPAFPESKRWSID